MEWIWRPKLVFVGSPMVGKTSLIKVFCGEDFPAYYQMTAIPQLNYHRITLKETRKVEPFVFDLPSDELFETRWDRIEAEADVQVYVYDVTRKETLDDVVNKWTAKLRDQSSQDIPPCPGLLIGNKSDLCGRRVVSAAAGAEVAEYLGLEFMETSAKDNRGVAFGARGSGEANDQLGGGEGGGEGEGVEHGALGAGGSGGEQRAEGGGGGEPAVGEGFEASNVAGGGVCCKGGISDAISFFLRHLETRTGGGKKDKDLIQLENALNIN